MYTSHLKAAEHFPHVDKSAHDTSVQNDTFRTGSSTTTTTTTTTATTITTTTTTTIHY